MKPIENKGTILQIQSFSVNDGEGIRSVIFLPGCGLRCHWCANPETWTTTPKLAVYYSKCTGCGSCKKVCPNALFPPKELNLLPTACDACGICAENCPSGALVVLCTETTVEEVVRRIARDEIFFRNSGGGVTFSGGEPTYQTGFLRGLAQEFYNRGTNLYIETCGYFDWENVSDIFEMLDHVIIDIKLMDDALHRKYTGVSNKKILENCKKIHKLGKQMTIRIPSIKYVNLTEENFLQTATFIRQNLSGARIELLGYHNLGAEKYMALSLNEHLHEFIAPTLLELEQGEDCFRRQGVEVVRYR